MTHFFTARIWQWPLICLSFCLFGSELTAQCNPDVTPPVAVCKSSLAVSTGTLNGLVEIDASALNANSFDDCCLGAFLAKRVNDGPCDADTLSDDYTSTLTFCCEDIGATVTVSLQVSDCAGNTEQCQTTVVVQDKTRPTIIAPPNVTVACEDFDPTLQSYGVPVMDDNCCTDYFVVSDDYGQFEVTCVRGTITRTYKAYDCHGNGSLLAPEATQTIVVEYNQEYYLAFPDDLHLTGPHSNDYGQPVFWGESCKLLSVSYEDIVYIDTFPNAGIRTERNWTVINWCTFDPFGSEITIPNPNPSAILNDPANYPGPTVSAPGTPAPWTATVVNVNPSDPTPTDYSSFWANNANLYRYRQVVVNEYVNWLSGNVFADSSANCTYESGERLLANWKVRAVGGVTGQILETFTDANGHYQLLLNGEDTLVTVTLVAAINFSQNCQSQYIVEMNSSQVTQDIPVYLEEQCDLLSVGLGTPLLRRCFENRYTLQACNQSIGTISDVTVEVLLDNYFEYDTSSIPGTLISGNTYSFPLGDLLSGECVIFTIDFTVSCNAPLGITHCSEVHISPYDDCSNNSLWSGANVSVNALCDGDSVRFFIENTGTADMTEMLNFVVVEDVVMRQEGSFQLNMGEVLTLSEPANGSTWRLEAEEEPFHPWGGVQAAVLEGCGGLNSVGLVNVFPINNADPFVAIDCRENIGSYDPNDKQGFPIGVGSQHFIKENTDIEYLIRFQNTGTDTAFTVVILDTLSDQLDASTVRILVASHPMEFSKLDDQVLRFTFPNILLPDSNTNWAASNGFVKFRVAQQKNLSVGTTIENSADIYFDFNDPITTNTTLHTIGKDFLTLSTEWMAEAGLLRAYPNPAEHSVWFELENEVRSGYFDLYNALGQRVSSEAMTGERFLFERKNLPAGMYHFEIRSQNSRIARGKIVFR